MSKIYVAILSLFFVFGTLTVSADNKEQLVDIKGNPDKFELNQNYPNPFNPSTQLSCIQPATTKLLSMLTIYPQVFTSINYRLETIPQ